jgi:hypothetical protein
MRERRRPPGENIIHSLTNPINRLTGAIHVYGGDFFAAERSEWDPETLQEGRYDVAKNMVRRGERPLPNRVIQGCVWPPAGIAVPSRRPTSLCSITEIAGVAELRPLQGTKLTSPSSGRMSASSDKADIGIELAGFR